MDRDGNGLVNSADVSAFLNAWFIDLASGSLTADFDADGVTNSADLTAFMNAWFLAL